MIVIVDHGMGNLGSVQNMLRKIGAHGVRTADPEAIGRADKLILAGIGAFDGAAERLAELGLVDGLNEMVLERKVPVLGVCLGMQLVLITYPAYEVRTQLFGAEPSLPVADSGDYPDRSASAAEGQA